MDITPTALNNGRIVTMHQNEPMHKKARMIYNLMLSGAIQCKIPELSQMLIQDMDEIAGALASMSVKEQAGLTRRFGKTN